MSDELQIREPNWTAPDAPVEIQGPEEYSAAATALQEAKEFQKRVTAWFRPLKEKAHAAWKGLTQREKETLAPAVEFESKIKSAMVRYDDEQERLRQEEQRRLEAEARRQEEERRLAEAEALEAEANASGDTELKAQAEQLLAEPIETPVVQVEKATPKVAGVSYRESWGAQIVNLQALIVFAAKNPGHQNLLQPNMPALNAQARSLKGKMQIPGVKAVAKRTVASSGC